MKVVGIGRGPELRNLGIERDHVANFDRAEDDRRGENHDASRNGLVIVFLASEPE